MYNNPQPNFEPYIESVDWNAVNTIRLVGDYDWGSAEINYPLLYVNDSLVYRSSSYLMGEEMLFYSIINVTESCTIRFGVDIAG